MNGWGFQRVCNQDPGEYNSYYHELFVRDDPKKCLKMIRYGGAKNAGGERIIPYGGSKERKVKRMECEDITTIPSSVAGAPGVLVERGQETSEVERACEAKKRSKCSNQSFDDKEESLNKSRKKPLSRRKKRKVITTKPMPAVTARNET